MMTTAMMMMMTTAMVTMMTTVMMMVTMMMTAMMMVTMMTTVMGLSRLLKVKCCPNDSLPKVIIALTISSPCSVF